MSLFTIQKQMLALYPGNTFFMRYWFEANTLFLPQPAHIVVHQETMDHVPVEIIENKRQNKSKGRHLFYLHGGGFVIGSPRSYRPFVTRLGQRCYAETIWTPDYRKAPEHPFPAALDDVVLAWKVFLKRHGDGELLLAGDSAGGNLALALCVIARDQGLTLPEKVYLQSPWLDLTLSSSTHERFDHRDPFLGTWYLERHFARHYAKDTSRTDPLLSPLYADLHGLPPFLVQVGSREILLDDSRRFVKKAKDVGVDATLEVWRGLWHAWPQVPFVPESTTARRQAAHWLAS